MINRLLGGYMSIVLCVLVQGAWFVCWRRRLVVTTRANCCRCTVHHRRCSRSIRFCDWRP